MASIRKRGECSYQIIVSGGYAGDGRKLTKQKTVTLDPKLTPKQIEKELERLAILFEEEVKSGDYINPNTYRLSNFCEEYLEFAKGKLAPRTLEFYSKTLAQRLTPKIGHYKLTEIKPLHIQRLVSDLQKPGQRKDGKGDFLSSASVRKIHAVICSIFSRAYKLQLITKNPATTENIDLPKLEQNETQIFDEVQSLILLEALEMEPLKYQVLVHLSLTIGSRRGEVMALTWNDINLDTGIVSIKHSAYKLSGEERKLKDPKNKNSIRDISIPEYVVEMLKAYRKEQVREKIKIGDLWLKDEKEEAEKNKVKFTDPGWIFNQWDGHAMNPDFPSGWFPKFIRKHNKAIYEDKTLKDEQKEKLYLPQNKFHSLRHTSGTLLLYNGHNVKSVGSRLGHTQISTTNRYLHLLKKADKAQADTMQAIFKKPSIEKNPIVVK